MTMKYRIWGGIVLLLVLLFAANLFLGSARIPFRAVLGILVGEEGEKTAWTYIVWQTRFPQAVTALFSGASLAVAGLMLQTVFANPLAGPSILGIDSGASLGVALVMLLCGGTVGAVTVGLTFSGYVAVVVGAFAGAALILGLIIFFSTLIRSNVMLLIIGMMMGYIASSAISLLNFFATAEGVFPIPCGEWAIFRACRQGSCRFLRDTVGRVAPGIVVDETVECAFIGRAVCRESGNQCPAGAGRIVNQYGLAHCCDYGILRTDSLYRACRSPHCAVVAGDFQS